jgi:glycosyltransferase involved in cell wall biosynthesis
VPTRDRPAKLRRCLVAIAGARRDLDLPVLVADSSDDARHAEVRRVCAEFDFVRLRRHGGRNVAAARNFCAREAAAEFVISVDDDVYVEPDALAEMIAAVEAADQPAVVAGAVAWDGVYHEPVVMRRIGYGRPVRAGEAPDFLVTALFAFPRELGLALGWNERIGSSDDLFVGALWRSHGVELRFAPAARAQHDPEHHRYGPEAQSSHIYVNLFDALVANPNPWRAFCFEFLGFAAGAKLYFRAPGTAGRYVAAWLRGNLRFLHDLRFLRAMVRRPLPGR